jgi:DNA-binding MarR family transcriptional regulator
MRSNSAALDPVAGLSSGEPPNWTLLSNHGHLLLCLARDPQARIRDLAEMVGITERACYRIIGDLVDRGLVRRERHGRNNRYTINRDARMLHPAWSEITVARLLAIVEAEEGSARGS